MYLIIICLSYNYYLISLYEYQKSEVKYVS